MHDNARLVNDALLGRGTPRPIAGVSWLPERLLAELASALPTSDRRLARVVSDAGLDFAFVPADADWSDSAARLLNDEGVAVVWAVAGPLWPAIEAHGLGRAMTLIARRPETLSEELAGQLDRVQRDVERGLMVDAAAFVLAEELASDRGPLVPPDYAITQAIPSLRGAVALICDAGRAAVFHSDGDTRALLDSMLYTGFTALHVGGGLDRDHADLLGDEVARRGLTRVGGLPASLLEAYEFAFHASYPIGYVLE